MAMPNGWLTGRKARTQTVLPRFPPTFPARPGAGRQKLNGARKLHGRCGAKREKPVYIIAPSQKMHWDKSRQITSKINK